MREMEVHVCYTYSSFHFAHLRKWSMRPRRLRQRRVTARADGAGAEGAGRYSPELLAADQCEAEHAIDAHEDRRQLQLQRSLITKERATSGVCAPSYEWVAPTLLVLVRAVAVLFSPIPDCDEVFNYWDPMHYLLYGDGLQTWEYSALYALRSYLYVGMHALVGAPFAALGLTKPTVFFSVRTALALATAACELRFLGSVRAAFGAAAATRCALFLASTPGMFQASVAFLPSSFAMALGMLAHAHWLDALTLRSRAERACDACEQSARADAHADAVVGRAYTAAIAAVAGAAILGWPYAALLGLPLALETIRAIGLLGFVGRSAAAGVSLALPSALVDSFYYGRPTLNVWNQLVYNLAVDKHAGSQLYGIEPWYYYLHNLAINLNLVLPAALLLPVLLLCRHLLCGRGLERGDGGVADDADANADDRADRPGAPLPRLGPWTELCACSAALLWLATFSLVPHSRSR